jgi:hypothetical protein
MLPTTDEVREIFVELFTKRGEPLALDANAAVKRVPF